MLMQGDNARPFRRRHNRRRFERVLFDRASERAAIPKKARSSKNLTAEQINQWTDQRMDRSIESDLQDRVHATG